MVWRLIQANILLISRFSFPLPRARKSTAQLAKYPRVLCHKVNIGIQVESEKTKSVFSLDAIVRFTRTHNNKLTSEGR